MITGIETGTFRTATVFQKINSGLPDSYQSTEFFVAASLEELWIAAAAFHLVEKGEADLAKPLSLDWRQFREGNYGTGRLRSTPRAILMRLAHRANSEFRKQLIPPQPLHLLLRRSVEDSDNLATIVVADALWRPKLQRVIDSWGMKDTIVYDPEMNGPVITTAADVAKFLLDLKRGHLIWREHQRLLLSWMKKRTILNQESQPNTILYKDGQYPTGGGTYFNRAGYVTTCYGDPYLFVMLTKDYPGYNGRISTRQKLITGDYTEEIAQRVI
ncbi:serine hydrolase [Candidatus Daviesbacteria bacterium]|nr:serine hydrolase [Candidatus Daviesbacteria bacterium]